MTGYTSHRTPSRRLHTCARLSKFALLMVLVACVSCKKDTDDPAPPVIEYNSISATSVTEFTNTVRITFSYEDYQGDLGEQDPDRFSLRIKDDRLDDFDWYHIPPMTPDMEELHIKGKYTVEINPLFLLGNGGSETTRLTLRLRDRAGNWSNTIVTPTITIAE